MEPAGGIQQDGVVAVVLGVVYRMLGNLYRIYLAQGEHRDPQLVAHHLQLSNGRGTVYVTGNQQGALAHTVFQVACQFGAVGSFAGTLETDHHDHRGAAVGKGNFGVGPAHEVGELFVDDFDNLLSRGKALQYVGAHSPLGNACDEVLDNLVADVGFQQSQTHFPHGLLDVGLGDAALAPQALKCGA